MSKFDYSWLILLRRLTPAEYGKWEGLRSEVTEGDEIWEYECSESDQHPLGGTAGVALKRGDAVVGHVVTRQTFFR